MKTKVFFLVIITVYLFGVLLFYLLFQYAENISYFVNVYVDSMVMGVIPTIFPLYKYVKTRGD